jgi:signal transduction histidine kinase
MMLRIPIWHWFSCLPIRQKVAWGYGLSLGVAIAGTGFGIVLADQQQQRAELIAEDVREELELINHLKEGAMQTFLAQEQFKGLLSVPQNLPEYYKKWREASHQFREAWEEFEETEGGTKGQEAIEREGEVEAVEDFLEKHEDSSEKYFQAIDRLLSSVDATNFSSEDIVRLQTGLSQLQRSSFMTSMNELIEDLATSITPAIYEESEEAEEGIRTSYALRLWVIGVSMATSVAIAIVLSIFISRAITYPIQSLTQVTQQALNESNFDLQSPVTTEDEVGTLATSFNHLIMSVKNLLDQQQHYSQTLEVKVAERTQELKDKNVELQDLLEKFRTTQVQMLQSEKMSSLGQLVAGVAHEINNPINFIHGNLTHLETYTHDLLGFVQLYQKYYPTPIAEIEREAEEIDLPFLQEDFSKLVSSMKIGTDRIRDIVTSLRNFSRLDEAEFKTVNIHEGIDSTLLILQHRLKARSDYPAIQVIQDYANLPMVDCYPGQLNQVFMNILANAIDALEEFNTKRTIQTIKDHPNQIKIRTSISGSKWVQIAIADNGPGMPEAIQKQIFNPFFTTKPIGKGTGIGMAISYQIVSEKHNGKLECFSTVGEGTKFIIQIPIKQQVQTALLK